MTVLAVPAPHHNECHSVTVLQDSLPNGVGLWSNRRDVPPLPEAGWSGQSISSLDSALVASGLSTCCWSHNLQLSFDPYLICSLAYKKNKYAQFVSKKNNFGFDFYNSELLVCVLGQNVVLWSAEVANHLLPARLPNIGTAAHLVKLQHPHNTRNVYCKIAVLLFLCIFSWIYRISWYFMNHPTRRPSITSYLWHHHHAMRRALQLVPRCSSRRIRKVVRTVLYRAWTTQTHQIGRLEFSSIHKFIDCTDLK